MGLDSRKTLCKKLDDVIDTCFRDIGLVNGDFRSRLRHERVLWMEDMGGEAIEKRGRGWGGEYQKGKQVKA